MRKFAVVLLMMGFAQASALGGVISFGPDPATVDRSAGDSEVVKLDVFISGLTESGDLFGSFDIIFGAGIIADGETAGLDIVSFVVDPVLVARQLFPSTIVDNFKPDLYLDDIKVGYFVNQFGGGTPFDLSNLGGSLLIGSLTVDTSALDLGKYDVVVDFDADDSSFTTGPPAAPGNSFLFGAGSVNVVPEPATITLLGLASLALVRRRRRA